jgi:cell division septation protein DedD
MNHGDNDDRDPSSDQQEEQLGFDPSSFDENPRRLEPVFEDLETLRSFEESSDEEGESSFESTLYSSEYEDDTIDYDVDPERMVADEEGEAFESEPDSEITAGWQMDDLKPELVREPDLELEPETDSGRDNTDRWSAGEDEETGTHWPLGLIVVVVFALLLLAAGGYGVMQQRARMQDEIRTLRATVATSASPDELSASREARRVLEGRNAELSTTIDALHVEVSSLRDRADGLASQLAEAQSVVVEKATLKATAVIPPPTKKPAAAAAGSWFVNFGSYQNRDTASSWAARLKPTTGQVVVVSGVRNGDTFYRVRVVELTSKKQAEGIARTLEQAYDLSELWIGKR